MRPKSPDQKAPNGGRAVCGARSAARLALHTGLLERLPELLEKDRQGEAPVLIPWGGELGGTSLQTGWFSAWLGRGRGGR